MWRQRGDGTHDQRRNTRNLEAWRPPSLFPNEVVLPRALPPQPLKPGACSGVDGLKERTADSESNPSWAPRRTIGSLLAWHRNEVQENGESRHPEGCKPDPPRPTRRLSPSKSRRDGRLARLPVFEARSLSLRDFGTRSAISPATQPPSRGPLVVSHSMHSAGNTDSLPRRQLSTRRWASHALSLEQDACRQTNISVSVKEATKFTVWTRPVT